MIKSTCQSGERRGAHGGHGGRRASHGAHGGHGGRRASHGAHGGHGGIPE